MIIVLLFPVMVMEVDNANDEDNNDGDNGKLLWLCLLFDFFSRTSQRLCLRMFLAGEFCSDFAFGNIIANNLSEIFSYEQFSPWNGKNRSFFNASAIAENLGFVEL